MSGGSKKQTVGYKYSLGAHMGFCHGPIDKVTRIRVADRVAWEGESTGGQIFIDNEDLFGGPDREGGIFGSVDFEFGEPTQDVNDYLQAKQNVSGETVPAYRGIAAAVLRQVYLGTNPYLKPWEFRAQRIHTSTRGAVQWYDEKSEVPGEYGSIISSWDLSTLTYNGVSKNINTESTNTQSIFVANNNEYLFVLNTSNKTIYRYEMSISKEIDSAAYSGNNSGPLTEITGTAKDLWISNDGIKVFVLEANSGFLRQYSLSSAWDLSTISYDSVLLDLGNETPPGGDFIPANIAFDDSGSILFFSGTSQDRIYQWTLSGSFDISSAIYSGSSFYVGTQSGSLRRGMFFGDSGRKLYLCDDNFDRIYQYTLSTAWSISTASYDNISFLVTGQTNTPSDIFSSSDGEKLYLSSSGSVDIVYQYDFSTTVQSGDMNPAHIIRECLTDTNWGLGYTSADIDDTAFTTAADTLFGEEFGMSLLWSQQSPIEDFIRDVLRHIDGVLYVDPRTGKFTLKLIRDDYVAASLPILDESNIISIRDYKKPAIGELTNYVTVKYWDRSTSEDSAISVQDIALAQQQGSVVSADVPMPGITGGALASRVASRELAALSNPLITCTIIANREAASLNIGDAFKLTWPKFGLTETIMRVTNAQFGTLQDGSVKLECVQDVFGLPQSVFSEPTDSNFVTPTNAPANSPFRLVQEANYWTLIQDQGEDFTFDPLDGYLLTAATTPSADALNYRIWTDESGSYVEKEPADFCPTATITHDFPRVVNGVIQTVVGIAGLDADDVADIDIGSIAQIGNEFLEVVSVSTTSLTVGRAVVDTPVEDHVTGDRIFFWGNSFYGFSATLYQDNDTIGVKITPATAQGQLDVADATEQTLTFDQRAYRAWLPGNLAIGGSYFPSSVEGVETVDSSWAHRDRTLQTAGLNDFTEASIGPEVGTTYTTTLTRVNTSAQLDQNTGLTGTTDSLDPAGYDGLVRFEIVSVRDALDSYHTHSHEFIVTRTSALQEEQGLFLFTEDNEAIITES